MLDAGSGAASIDRRTLRTVVGVKRSSFALPIVDPLASKRQSLLLDWLAGFTEPCSAYAAIVWPRSIGSSSRAIEIDAGAGRSICPSARPPTALDQRAGTPT